MWEDSRRQEDAKNTRQRYKRVIKQVTVPGEGGGSYPLVSLYLDQFISFK